MKVSVEVHDLAISCLAKVSLWMAPAGEPPIPIATYRLLNLKWYHAITALGWEQIYLALEFNHHHKSRLSEIYLLLRVVNTVS